MFHATANAGRGTGAPRRPLRATLILATLAAALILPGAAQAAIESLVGKPPARLLKQHADFARAFRLLIQGRDLPGWSSRMAVGFPSELIEVDGRRLLLTSACSPKGCNDERLYVVYDPATRRAEGFFFLPPNLDNLSDSRMALSVWLGQPAKPLADYLLDRALKDATQGSAAPDAAQPQ